MASPEGGTRRAFLRRLVPLGAWLIAAVLFLLRWTTRKELVNDQGLYARWRAGERLIIAFWHEQLVMMPFPYSGRRAAIMVSRALRSPARAATCGSNSPTSAIATAAPPS